MRYSITNIEEDAEDGASSNYFYEADLPHLNDLPHLHQLHHVADKSATRCMYEAVPGAEEQSSNHKL